MNINAAPRVYTSNLVSDSDLNMGQHNIIANAMFPRDNYLLSILNRGEAFPSDVREGDRVFKWGSDSTKSYIYTYLNGAWDQGVKPQHMQDYYIADENRIVKFYLIRSSEDSFMRFSLLGKQSCHVHSEGLLFGPDVYIIGSLGCIIEVHSWSSLSAVAKVSYVQFVFTDCTTTTSGVRRVFSPYEHSFVSTSSGDYVNYDWENVVVPSCVNGFSFNTLFGGIFLSGSSDCISSGAECYTCLSYVPDV